VIAAKVVLFMMKFLSKLKIPLRRVSVRLNSIDGAFISFASRRWDEL
jgi:hypothetical protein